MTKLILYIAILTFFCSVVLSEETFDHAVLLSARIDSLAIPPSIILRWDNSDKNSQYFKVFRKGKAGKVWKELATLNKNVDVFIDSTIKRGVGYEYHVLKITKDSIYSGYGYIYAGYDLTTDYNKNKILLLIDDSVSKILNYEIERMMIDLRADGYIVKKYDVERTETFYAPAVLRTKRIIDYERQSGNLGTIFLFGRVAVPYSGNTSWDGHPEHSGAWPADLFYSTATNYWTDEDVLDSKPTRTENKNIPHDGKFDESTIISTDIQLGRIDMFNLPAIPTSETELLRQYLDKDHNFKVHNLVLTERGLLDDGFRLYSGEAFASDGWMNFSALLGKQNIDTSKFDVTLRTKDYLWSYGCNSGSYNSVYHIAYTDDIAKYQSNTVFSILFGSFNGDWDTQNNVLRGFTASAPSALCVLWAGRPYWYFHHMGLGETIGYAANLTQNNNGLYDGTGKFGRKGIHINLIGDPTLRMRYVAPPTDLETVSDTIISGSRNISLSWKESNDNITGYNIYYATGSDLPFIQTNSAPIKDLHYTLQTEPTPFLTILVRAVKPENTNSGSYNNLSLGAMLVLGTETSVPEQVQNEQLLISPNPATDYLYITCKNLSGNPVKYSIYTTQGEEIFSGVKDKEYPDLIRITIDIKNNLNNPAPGLYFIKILSDNKLYLGKFLIIK